MAEVLEYAARLSQVIGARPSGTEEEQKASFFIEETFQQAGLETQIEEFNCNPNYEMPRVACCIAAAVFAVLAVLLQLVVIPAFILTLILAIVFVLELLGASPFNRTANRGISQNVVARYIPGVDAASGSGDDFLLDGARDSAAMISGLDDGTGPSRGRGRGGRASARKRKIVVIARYDSGKVRHELTPAFLKVLEFLPWVEIGGFALIPLALLVRMIADAQGPLLVVLNTIVIIGVIAILIPVIIFALHKTAPWSDGANNNAAGTAVMLEVAQRIAKSAKVSAEAALPAASAHRVDGTDDLVVMHGEDAVTESGMLPVGTDLIYDEAAAGELTQEALEAKAEAALAVGAEEIAATEEPVRARAAEQPEPVAVPRAEAQPAPAPAFVPSSLVSPNTGKSDVPDWFKKGIAAANANKEAQEQEQNTPIQRSRFSDALDAARETSAGSIEEFASRESAGAGDGAAGASTDEFASPWSPSSVGAGTAKKTSAPAAQASSASAAKAESATQKKTPSSSQKTGEISLATAAALEGAQAQEAAQLAQSVEEVAEQAAAADRTISFIPVAADIPAEISAADVVESVGGAQPDVLAKTPEEILAEANSATGVSGNPRAAAASGKNSKRQKRTIALPSLTGAMEAVSANMQAAPLADDAERAQGEERAVAAKRDMIASSVPVLNAQASQPEPESEPATFASSSFEPVGDDLIANMEQDDIVIEDVDDSDYETNTTPTGAIAGPGYVEMPKSRASRLRGIFGRKKKAEETSFVEAVGLDADFDARKVGADRGGWESFQNESADWDSQAADKKEPTAKPTARTASTARTGAKPTTRTAQSSRSAKAASASSAAADTGSASSQGATSTKSTRSSRSGRGAHSRSLDEMRAEEQTSRTRRTKSDWDDWGDFDDWNGGGFSLSRIGDAVKGAGDAVKGMAKGASDAPADDADVIEEVPRGSRGSQGRRSSRGSDGRQRRQRPGGLLAAMAQDAADEVNASESAYAVTDGSTARSSRGRGRIDAEDMIDEREQIRSFRASSTMSSFEDIAAFAGSLGSHDDEEEAVVQEAEGDMHDLAQPQGFQTEVWFVALGAELADNAGVKAFLDEHTSDLRGAVIIDIEALGAGTLSLIDSEGALRHVKTSSRMKRYVTKAGSALGMRIGSEKMNWCESAAFYTAKKGLQTIHVAGMLNGKPAYMGEADDRIDNLDEDKLLENAAFVLELLHNI